MNSKVKFPFFYSSKGQLKWGEAPLPQIRKSRFDATETSTNSISLLVLVLSCASFPFNHLMQTQIATWACSKVEGVRVVFYLGGSQTLEFDDPVLHLPCPDDYPEMHWKFKLALEFVQNWSWDFIFRTNASAYIDLQTLKNFASTLPREKCYCGIHGPTSNAKFLHVNGAGIFLSRDVAMIVKDGLQFNQTPHVEDGEIARVLHGKVSIQGGKRTETTGANARIEKGAYHYKLRSKDPDRASEIAAMHALHRQLHP